MREYNFTMNGNNCKFGGMHNEKKYKNRNVKSGKIRTH